MQHEQTKSPKLLIAGGGTGGHVFPGIAIAEEWRRRGGVVVFVGTKTGKEMELVPQAQFSLRTLSVGRLKGLSLLKKLKTLVLLPGAFWSAARILREEHPAAVVGIGGYASGPICLMARLKGYHTAIQDRDIPAGFTNKILGKFVHTVFTSFEQSRIFFSSRKVICTGNAIRTQIRTTPYVLPKDMFCLLIFGGSLGAVPMNEMVLQAVDQNKQLWPRLKIFHQAGKTDEEVLKKFYWERNIQAVVERFFDNMNTLFQQAHLVICRSGAGTLSELAISGRPAVLIPYPFAADDHQRRNALVFVDAGAAWMIPQGLEHTASLSEVLRQVVDKPEELIVKAQRMLKLARPDATKEIVDELWGKVEREA